MFSFLYNSGKAGLLNGSIDLLVDTISSMMLPTKSAELDIARVGK